MKRFYAANTVSGMLLLEFYDAVLLWQVNDVVIVYDQQKQKPRGISSVRLDKWNDSVAVCCTSYLLFIYLGFLVQVFIV